MNPAREKVEREGRCRVCGIGPAAKLDAAHTWDRGKGGPGFDVPDAVIPLCSDAKGGTGCHQAYDRHRLDVLPYLTTAEQVEMVRNAGSIERARMRAIGRDAAPRARPAIRHPDDGPF